MSMNFQLRPDFSVRGHEKAVTSVVLSPGKTLLASAGADRHLKFYSPSTGHIVKSSENDHTAGLNDACWLTDNYLVTASDDGNVRVIDFETGTSIARFSTIGIDRFPYCLSIHPRSRLLTVGCTDGSVMTFHTSSKSPIHQLLVHGSTVTSVCYSSYGDELLTSSYDGSVRQWIPSTNLTCLRTIVPANYTPISKAVYGGGENYILTSSQDHTHRIFHRKPTLEGHDSQKQSHIMEYTGHVNEKYGVFCSMFQTKMGAFIASGGDEGKISLWEVETGRMILDQQCHEGAILCGQIHSDGGDQVFYSGSADGHIGRWILDSNNTMDTLDDVKSKL